MEGVDKYIEYVMQILLVESKCYFLIPYILKVF